MESVTTCNVHDHKIHVGLEVGECGEKLRRRKYARHHELLEAAQVRRQQQSRRHRERFRNVENGGYDGESKV